MAEPEQTTMTFYYSYDYNETDDDSGMCDMGTNIHFGSVFNVVFLPIVVILSLLGNCLVIVILVKYENLKSLTNTFIFNLALSDLFFTAGLPFWAHYHMHTTWTLGAAACKIVNFIFYVGFYSSGILLILMTIHRFVIIMNPLSNVVSVKGFYSVLVSVIIWAASVLAASPAVIFTNIQNGHCGYLNSYWNIWGIYQQNLLFIVSSVVFIFCYSQIMCRLLSPTAQRRRSRTLKLIFILVIVFFLGWGPYNVVMFWRSFYYLQHIDRCEIYRVLEYTLNISRLFAFSHCCLNPVFYVFVGVKFKNHLKKLLKGWGHRNTTNPSNSIRSRQSRLTITSVTSGEEFSL